LPSSGDLEKRFFPQSYGAKGDGKTNDRAAIQAAIDAAWESGGGVVFLPSGIYLVDATAYYNANNNVYGITSLVLKSGVTLQGASRDSTVIKLQANAYGNGAFFRLISSVSTGVSDVAIRNITIDGNRGQQGANEKQQSNILLETPGGKNIAIENVRSINSNGQGIQVRGSPTEFARNIRYTNNVSENHAGICFQASQFDGLIISGNFAENCGDNGIDVYGDDGSLECHAKNYVISNNVVKAALVGVFNETVRDGTVSGNTISNTAIGITVNRIHGEPRNITISGNTLLNSSNAGVRITGDTGGVFITGNTLGTFAKSGVELNNTSGVTVANNMFRVSASTIPLVLLSGPHANFCRVNGIQSTNYPVSIQAGYEVKVIADTAVGNVL
jgi:hypothetical protein